MDDFYLTLPSNSSLSIFPNNKQTEYRTKLSSIRNLDGQWEVALCELRYPCSWHNISKDQLWFKFRGTPDQAWVQYELPSRYYPTMQNLLAAIGELILEPVPSIYLDEENPRKLRYRSGYFMFSDRLSELLGLSAGQIANPGDVSTYEFDLNIHHHTLYLYCDFLGPQLLRDAAVPL